MKPILLTAVLFPIISLSQSINADIKVKFDLPSPSRTLLIFNQIDSKIDTVPFPANNEWTYKGPLSSAGEMYITTSDTIKGVSFWVDDSALSFTCKEILTNKGRRDLAIYDLKGSHDSRLFDIKLVLSFRSFQTNVSPFLPVPERDSLMKASIAKHYSTFLDSLFTTDPASPILPYYLSFFQRTIGQETTTYFYNKLPDKIKLGYEGQKIKNFLDRSSLLRKGTFLEDFTIINEKGHPFKLSTVKANYILLDFWASWCGPCRAENPGLVKTYWQYKQKGFEIFSVSLDEDEKDWIKAINKDKLTWIHGSDLKGRESELIKKYKIGPIPFMVLLNDRYEVVAVDIRARDLNAILAGLLK